MKLMMAEFHKVFIHRNKESRKYSMKAVIQPRTVFTPFHWLGLLPVTEALIFLFNPIHLGFFYTQDPILTGI